MPESISFMHVNSIETIGPDNWCQCFGQSNPFNRYEFLSALEQSRCINLDTGWQPYHLMVTDSKTQKLVAVMPMYIKHHSWGEYVFDWAWAEAYERNGLGYYPKLVTSIPFTPSVGTRIGLTDELTPAEQTSLLSKVNDYLVEHINQHGFSSWHGLFVTSNENTLWPKQGVISRHGVQFHWVNHQYNNFDDFLNRMTSRKRKTIKKERAKLAQYNLKFSFVIGSEASDDDWQHFIDCYQITYHKRSGHSGYLSGAFFKLLKQFMGQDIRLLLVSDESGNKLACALFFVSQTHLYGRYWGTKQELDGLHFETCYYQGIEYAIEHGLAIFDAGAQGEHKVARGFEPVTTFSKHLVAHEQFSDAIGHYCKQEQLHMSQYQQQMTNMLPFKSK
ncbi:GNAT family N-acetyltransferase [Shewanella gaetbuli]